MRFAFNMLGCFLKTIRYYTGKLEKDKEESNGKS